MEEGDIANEITYTWGRFARAARLTGGLGCAAAADKRDVPGVDHEVFLSIIIMVSSRAFESINTTKT